MFSTLNVYTFFAETLNAYTSTQLRPSICAMRWESINSNDGCQASANVSHIFFKWWNWACIILLGLKALWEGLVKQIKLFNFIKL